MDVLLRVPGGSPVLDIAVLPERNLLACALANGGVTVHACDSGELLSDAWRPLAFDGSKAYSGERARSIAFVPTKVGGSHCVVVGGSGGAMHARYLANLTDDQSEVYSASRPGGLQLLPSHGGSIVALAPLGGGASAGLFISGAHDGTLRVWDLAGTLDTGDTGPVCLYGLGGYKVWLGSVCCDGERLVSDGRDNCLLVHDFTSEAIAEWRDPRDE